MTGTATVPRTAEELRAAILERYDTFSKRLQQIARFVLDHPDDLALETLAVVAERSGVQPSAIVRFAKALGYSGAMPMQRLLRDGLLANHTALGYGERVRQFNVALDQQAGVDGDGDLLAEFVDRDTLALENLRQTMTKTELTRAVKLIDQAQTLYVIGFRRAFPVASYLAYSLQQVGKRTIFVDGVGGLTGQQMGAVGETDLLIAISYHPYAEETVHAVEAAVSAGAKVLSITDSLVSPMAKMAAHVLQVRESEVRGFRSLAASLCLAQTLVITLAFERERAGAKSASRTRRRKA
ncbi:MurR/RpiR family transcriptional regulator [Nitrospirillum iridis]|uniref:DNA-binding MurR/RpiR family transcriptional regulator n=1 Tax=Nitrospirillum iridis TaxID=765888 RepID=A0A7X0AXY1_9PROT|nr:MurR/RpiR family transcriptional regulator [Nitrospirillum iridis]MBB6251140.1 DNA-binding MurR/RpiR family transcriptional regulator [Nitrospirillum iridis]